MSLVTLGGLVQIGSLWSLGQNAVWATASVLQDAAKEACIMYGHVMTDDGGSHTIDTTNSSSLGWRSAAVTFANAGTTFKVGLATADTTNGPAGRVVNVADVITFDVSKSMTGGGGGVTANAWQEHVPDSGTKTIANGDLVAFATQMTALGGADLVNTVVGNNSVVPAIPSVTGFLGGAYAAVASAAANCIITFSDGHYGWFGGVPILSSATAQLFNSGSATKEFGNYLKFPFPVKIYGIYAMFSVGADCDFVLYSDPLGTPVAEKTVSIDANAITATSSRPIEILFPAPYTAAANQPLAVIAKPTTGTNVTMTYRSFNAAAHQITDHCGTNGYAVNRASGAFAAQNSNKDRFPIGLLVGAFSQENNQLINSAALVG